MLRQKMQIREGGKLSLNNRPPLVMVCLFSDAKTREHSSSASPFCGSFVSPNGVFGRYLCHLSFVFVFRICLWFVSILLLRGSLLRWLRSQMGCLGGGVSTSGGWRYLRLHPPGASPVLPGLPRRAHMSNSFLTPM